MKTKIYPNYLKESIGKDGKRSSPKLLAVLKNFIIDIDGVVSENIPNEEPQRMVTAREIPCAKKMKIQVFK